MLSYTPLLHSNLSINSLELKLIKIIFKNSPYLKRTHQFSFIKISWLMLFREINDVYTENHTKPINTLWGKYRVIDYYSIIIFGFEELRFNFNGPKSIISFKFTLFK
jgi:hypothetical protein